jgi:hypothetical protein
MGNVATKFDLNKSLSNLSTEDLPKYNIKYPPGYPKRITKPNLNKRIERSNLIEMLNNNIHNLAHTIIERANTGSNPLDIKTMYLFMPNFQKKNKIELNEEEYYLFMDMLYTADTFDNVDEYINPDKKKPKYYVPVTVDDSEQDIDNQMRRISQFEEFIKYNRKHSSKSSSIDNRKMTYPSPGHSVKQSIPLNKQGYNKPDLKLNKSTSGFNTRNLDNIDRDYNKPIKHPTSRITKNTTSYNPAYKSVSPVAERITYAELLTRRGMLSPDQQGMFNKEEPESEESDEYSESSRNDILIDDVINDKLKDEYRNLNINISEPIIINKEKDKKNKKEQRSSYKPIKQTMKNSAKSIDEGNFLNDSFGKPSYRSTLEDKSSLKSFKNNSIKPIQTEPNNYDRLERLKTMREQILEKVKNKTLVDVERLKQTIYPNVPSNSYNVDNKSKIINKKSAQSQLTVSKSKSRDKAAVDNKNNKLSETLYISDNNSFLNKSGALRTSKPNYNFEKNIHIKSNKSIKNGLNAKLLPSKLEENKTSQALRKAVNSGKKASPLNRSREEYEPHFGSSYDQKNRNELSGFSNTPSKVVKKPLHSNIKLIVAYNCDYSFESGYVLGNI